MNRTISAPDLQESKRETGATRRRCPPISTLGPERLKELGIDIHPEPAVYPESPSSTQSSEVQGEAVRSLLQRSESKVWEQLKPTPDYRVRWPPLSSLPKERLEELGIDIHPVPEMLELSLNRPNPILSHLELKTRSFAFLREKKSDSPEERKSRGMVAKEHSLFRKNVKFELHDEWRQKQHDIRVDTLGILEEFNKRGRKGTAEPRTPSAPPIRRQPRRPLASSCWKSFKKDMQVICCPYTLPPEEDVQPEVDPVLEEWGITCADADRYGKSIITERYGTEVDKTREKYKQEQHNPRPWKKPKKQFFPEGTRIFLKDALRMTEKDKAKEPRDYYVEPRVPILTLSECAQHPTDLLRRSYSVQNLRDLWSPKKVD